MPLPNTQIATPPWVDAQDAADWLMPSELAVLDGWPSPRRRTEWLAGRLAAKRLLREVHGLDPLTCRIGREGAAPVVLGDCPTGLVLSLSHSGGLGAASVCDRGAQGWVGLDVQQVRPVRAGLAARVLTDLERKQLLAELGDAEGRAGVLLLWALKEAAIKARRTAWGRALREMEVRLTAPGRAEISICGEATQTAEYVRLEGGWWLARSLRPLGPIRPLELARPLEPPGPPGAGATAGTGRAA